jgi:NSS family neurotransmitter:Na+ symporter
MQEKTTFSSKIGFVLSAAGSAVGLGNLWRFPYLAAKYGGGTFLFLYLILAISFGFTLMLTEIAIGRHTGSSSINAYRALNKRFGFVGYIGSLVPIIIFPYYCVIGGWVIKYLVVYLRGLYIPAAQDNYFSDFISNTSEPLIYLLIFIIVTAVIVAMGVQKGVEKFSKILMPFLILLTIGIAIYVIRIPGAMEGVIYYIKPDFSKISIKAILGALGQLFYSMSLAMGIMITYGSYLDKNSDLESSVTQIELFDTGIAFLSGLIIIPAVFAFSGGDEAALNSGAGLMFITLPKVFASVKLPTLLGGAFFFLVLFAALTSSISLMEAVVSIVKEKTGFSRITCCILVFVVSLILAIPSSLGYGLLSGIQILGLNILDFFDFLSNTLLMPIVALLTCILVGHVVTPKIIIDEVEQSGAFKRKKIYVVIIKYIAPLFLIAILVSSILNTFGIISL